MKSAAVRPSTVDVAIAVALLLLGVGELSGAIPGSTFPGNDRVHAVFVVLTPVPLLARRSFPLTTMLAVVGLTAAWQYSMYTENEQPPFEPFIALLIAVFGAGVLTAGRTARAAVVTVVVGTVFTVVDILAGKPPGMAIPPTVMILGVFVLGRLLALYRSQAVAAALRADRIAREHDAARETAVADERSRIARELHDVISHDVSLMVMQASIEQRMDGDDAARRAALASIESVGRDALTELRRMLGVLRSSGDAPLHPQAGLRQVDDLVRQCSASGLDVRLVTEGEPVGLPAGLDVAAYRVVQESLTNCVKHARGSAAVATIRYLPDRLEIDVVDGGPQEKHERVPDMPSSGHGLAGMRERVALFGGTLEAGPDPAGTGYRVRVRLPREAS